MNAFDDVFDMATCLGSCIDEAALHRTLERLPGLLSARSVLLLDYRPDIEPARRMAARAGAAMTWIDEYKHEIAAFDPVPALVARSRRVIDDRTAVAALGRPAARRYRAFLDDAGIGAFAIVPVLRRGEAIAGLGLHFDGRGPGETSVLAAGLLAPILLDAAERARGERSEPAAGAPSRRELECLRLASLGYTSWEIGEKLAVQERTVYAHLSRAAAKLGVRGRVQAVAEGLRRGLIR